MFLMAPSRTPIIRLTSTKRILYSLASTDFRFHLVGRIRSFIAANNFVPFLSEFFLSTKNRCLSFLSSSYAYRNLIPADIETKDFG